jgi:hypothetical protein
MRACACACAPGHLPKAMDVYHHFVTAGEGYCNRLILQSKYPADGGCDVPRAAATRRVGRIPACCSRWHHERRPRNNIIYLCDDYLNFSFFFFSLIGFRRIRDIPAHSIYTHMCKLHKSRGRMCANAPRS